MLHRFLAGYKATAVFKIGAEDSGELTLKTFICHKGTPFLKVSNRRSQYVDNSKERRNQMRDQIRSSKCRTASDQREQEIREYLRYISIEDGCDCQSYFSIPGSGDTQNSTRWQLRMLGKFADLQVRAEAGITKFNVHILKKRPLSASRQIQFISHS